jgi:large subunit ribosomal protein L25
MTEHAVFSAELKNDKGTGAARAVRAQNRIPAIVYGGVTQTMISLPLKEFVKEYNKGNIQSKIFELDLGSKKITVIPREVQTHPVTDVPEHVDFQEITEDTLIKVAIHVKAINDDKCPGIKKGGVMNIAQRVINFRCRPNSIPKHLEVDVSGLEIGYNVHINDIKLPTGITPIDKTNFVILSISGRAEEKEVAAEASADKK